MSKVAEILANTKIPQGLLLVSKNQETLDSAALEAARGILRMDKIETNPDYISIEAESVDDTRRLLAALSLKSFGTRVVVLKRAENLTDQAVNTLLKKIEEPSDKTYFVVLTSHEEKILPTLRSRLMAFHLEEGSENSSELAEQFAQIPDLISRLQWSKTIDPHEADLKQFLQTLYKTEMNKLDGKSFSRLEAILRTFEFLDGNVQANRALALLALAW